MIIVYTNVTVRLYFMHTTWRAIGLALAVILVSLVAELGGEYWFATTPTGQGILRNFLASQAQKDAAQYDTTEVSSTPIYKTGVLPVPSAWVTTDYFTAVNNVINDIALLNNANIEINSLLNKLSIKMLTYTFDGYYELMGQARQSSNLNQALVAQLAVHLSDLATANVLTKDAITKLGTQTAVTTGQSFTSMFDTYNSSIQTFLYGDAPTQSQIDDMGQKQENVLNASQAFADALKPLLEHILAEDLRISAAASTTSAN